MKEPGTFWHAPPWRQASSRLLAAAAAEVNVELVVCDTGLLFPKVSCFEPAVELSLSKLLLVVNRLGEFELEPLSSLTPLTPTAHSLTSSSHVKPDQPDEQEQAKLPMVF